MHGVISESRKAITTMDPNAGEPHVYRNCSSVSLSDSKGAGHFVKCFARSHLSGVSHLCREDTSEF